ncbi:hypothetical protein [Streptosporangium roseum]
MLAIGSGVTYWEDQRMFRNVDRMEGGPGDPKNGAEWWRWFKGWPAKVLVLIACMFAAAAFYTLVTQAIGG